MKKFTIFVTTYIKHDKITLIEIISEVNKIMLAAFIYWGLILINIAWLALSLYFSIFYLVRKENGNLWVFRLLNVLSAVVLWVTMLIYHTWGWGITQYSSLIYLILGLLIGLTVIQAILGREPKNPKTA